MGPGPILSQDCIDRLLKTLAQHEACLLMVPCKDTIKIVREGKVISTPPREEMMASQTPQAFHTQAILLVISKRGKKASRRQMMPVYMNGMAA